MAFVNEKPLGKPDEWRTIDYERDAVLKVIEGLPHGGGAWFNLFWRGEIIHFGAYDKLNGYADPNDNTKGLCKIFTVFQIKIPVVLEAKKSEIIALVSEALSEYRILYTHADIAEVKVDFSQCRYYRS